MVLEGQPYPRFRSRFYISTLKGQFLARYSFTLPNFALAEVTVFVVISIRRRLGDSLNIIRYWLPSRYAFQMFIYGDALTPDY